MVKLKTSTSSGSPYTLPQVSYYCWKMLRYFQRSFFSVLPRPHFPGSSLCVIIGEQLEFQFIHSSNTSRSRFVTAFCPCTTHFSERPTANDSFGSNFYFALHISSGQQIYDWNMWLHQISLRPFIPPGLSAVYLQDVSNTLFKLSCLETPTWAGPYNISRFILSGLKAFATFDGYCASDLSFTRTTSHCMTTFSFTRGISAELTF